MLKFQEPMFMGVTSSQWKTFTTSLSRASIRKSTKTFREEETLQEMVVELPQPWNQSKTFWQGQKRKVVRRNYPWLGSQGTYAPQCWSKAGRDQSCYLQEWTLGSTAQFTSQLTCLGNNLFMYFKFHLTLPDCLGNLMGFLKNGHGDLMASKEIRMHIRLHTLCCQIETPGVLLRRVFSRPSIGNWWF